MAGLGAFLAVVLLVGGVLLRRRLLIAIDLLVVVIVMLVHAVVALTIAVSSSIVIRSGSATNFTLTQSETAAAGFVFLAGAVYFLVFAVLMSPFVRGSEASAAEVASIGRRQPADWVQVVVGPAVLRAITVLALVFAVGTWLLNGSGFLSRESYQFLSPGSLGATFSLLTDPVGIAAAFCAFGARNAFDRAGSGVALIALTLSEAASASRGFAVLVAASFATATIFLVRSLAPRLLLAAVGAVATMVALCLAIQLRGGPQTQGLEAYIPWLLEGNFSLGPDAIDAATSNLLLSIPVGYKSALAPLPTGFLPISLNPLAGSDSGWYLISPYLQLGYQTPSNGFGQLMAGSVIEQAEGIAAVALLLSIPTFFRRGLHARPRAISQFVTVALTSAGTLQLLQDSLRAGMRFVWAGVAFAIAIWVWDRVAGRTRQRHDEPASLHEVDGRLYVDGLPVLGLPARRPDSETISGERVQ